MIPGFPPPPPPDFSDKIWEWSQTAQEVKKLVHSVITDSLDFGEFWAHLATDNAINTYNY